MKTKHYTKTVLRIFILLVFTLVGKLCQLIVHYYKRGTQLLVFSIKELDWFERSLFRGKIKAELWTLVIIQYLHDIVGVSGVVKLLSLTISSFCMNGLSTQILLALQQIFLNFLSCKGFILHIMLHIVNLGSFCLLWMFLLCRIVQYYASMKFNWLSSQNSLGY